MFLAWEDKNFLVTSWLQIAHTVLPCFHFLVLVSLFLLPGIFLGFHCPVTYLPMSNGQTGIERLSKTIKQASRAEVYSQAFQIQTLGI